jgi:hypothetical protein
MTCDPTRHTTRLRRPLLASALLLCWLGPWAGVANGDADPMVSLSFDDAQGLVDELRERLAIGHAVDVEFVASNARRLSVARRADDRNRFHLQIEQAFFDSLTADERRAALAHELGHVWIFTNHPYLQTESGANRIALRVVSRESLASLYQKMWAHEGTTGDLARFLGEATPSDALAGLSDPRR